MKRRNNKILFICKDNPFGVGGANYASRAFLRAFSDYSDGNIDVFLSSGIVVDPEIKVNKYFFSSPKNKIKQLCSLISGSLHRHTDNVIKQLKDSDFDYDLCVFNNSKTSTGLIKLLKSKGIKIATIHHNVEPEYVRDNTPNILLRPFLLRVVRKAERTSYRLSDYNLFLTQQDMDSFHLLYGISNSVETVVGAFEFKKLPAWSPKKTNNDSMVFAITGSLCTVQGVDGISFFFEKLYKHLPQDSKIIISGRNPTSTIINYCNRYNNVQLVPNPNDINDIINLADIYICPTRLGGGLKLRVMDGLRLGIPVISHTCSARGYDYFLSRGFLSVFNDEKGFVEALNTQITMLKDGLINRQMVREEYEQHFSYEAGYHRIKTVLKQ